MARTSGWSIGARWLGVAVSALSLSCSSHSSTPLDGADGGEVDAAPPPLWFRDVSDASGLSAMSRDVSTWSVAHARMAGGVCAFDADADGHLDLFFASPDSVGGSKLFRARPELGPLRYEDATISAGLATLGETIGCLGVDLDGDGLVDLLTTGNLGARLFHNAGGHFVDQSALLPKLDDPAAMLFSAVAFDADEDGDLDLAVVERGHYDSAAAQPCNPWCRFHPLSYVGGHVVLWLQGDGGAFTDATARVPTKTPHPALVLLATDLDDDGHVDLFVGNELPAHDDLYFRNLGGGAFEETAGALGVAHSAAPSGVSTMSATDPDANADGRLDLLESGWEDETDALFVCAGAPTHCDDTAGASELFRTPKNLRWGQAMADFDDDGVPELIEASGHLFLTSDDIVSGPLGEPMVPPVFWRRTARSEPFALVGRAEAPLPSTAGRGLLATDLDGDGDLDVVVGSTMGHPLLLENTHAARGRALVVRLHGAGKNRGAIGARVAVRAGSLTQAAMVHAGQSYCSSDDGRLHFGVGGAATIDSVEVRWPSGAVTKLGDVSTGAPLDVEEK